MNKANRFLDKTILFSEIIVLQQVLRPAAGYSSRIIERKLKRAYRLICTPVSITNTKYNRNY